MLVRPFHPTDAGAVNAVALAAFAQYRDVYDDWATLSRGVGAMASLAQHAEIVVAEDERELLGAVAYCPPGSMPRADFFEPEWSIIRMLVVLPSARGAGVGRRLTRECIARARRDEAGVIALHTSPVMKVALSMYLRTGFQLAREVPDRFGVPYGLYLMQVG
jgi:ribosomal protein S18 acetylase RimI-like enzyme